LGREFTLVTDHQANVYLLDPLKKHPPIINNWIVLLSQYTCKVEHRPGKTLVIEDALSRSPNLLLVSIENIKQEQKKDTLLKQIIDHIVLESKVSKELKTLVEVNVLFSKMTF